MAQSPQLLRLDPRSEPDGLLAPRSASPMTVRVAGILWIVAGAIFVAPPALAIGNALLSRDGNSRSIGPG